nr:diaminopimelate epimerase [Allomuricauda sp.]
MELEFYKYQGTGNDFVIIDNRQNIFPKNDTRLIAELCDRRFGIGADGLILLEDDKMTDFNMVYYNSDGGESSMCGNGGRCLVAFAKFLGLIDEKTTFMAVDGEHTAEIQGDFVKLKMQNVAEIKEKPKYSYLDTGSPHHVQSVEELDTMDVATEGAKLRYGIYGVVGSNINFVSQLGKDSFKVRTYERGVEGETLSCGTGVTAVALAMHKAGKTESSSVNIDTPGGSLNISFSPRGEGYEDVYLKGPAKQVFKGIYKW